MATVNGGSGNDIIHRLGDGHSQAGYNDVTGVTTGDDTIGGLGGNDIIFGDLGNDLIDGGAGADSMNGGGGNDTYYVDDALDTVTEAAGDGIDRVLASLSYTLGAGVQVETLTTTLTSGTGAINLTGNEFGQTIGGNNGANTIDGKGGADNMFGYGGNDIYYVDTAFDRVNEAAGGGADSVFSSVSYVLAAGSEVETLATTDAAGTGAINLTGNEFGQTIQGNSGANIIDGKGGADIVQGFGGDDWYYVDNALDRIIETTGGGDDRVLSSVNYTLSAGAEVEKLTTTLTAGTAAINLTGNEFDQTLGGNFGNNILDGGIGADTMQGFGGNDWYYVDSASDTVVEVVNGGIDRVLTSVSYTLAIGTEIETLTTTLTTGTAAINLTGNEFGQTLGGNFGNNILDGKGGADIMQGFGGDDTYYVDNSGDQVIEAANGGTDSVLTLTSYALTAGSEVENLGVLSIPGHETDAIDIAGNEFAQTITGNEGANVLHGGGGTDTIYGNGGNDTIDGGEGTDTVYGNAGNDTVGGGDGADTVHGNEGNDTIDGGAGVDTVYGDDGDDTIDGGAGADTMYGGKGNDTYYVDDIHDVVVDLRGQGDNDVVVASVNCLLFDNVEIELMETASETGTDPINLTGNNLNQTIIGNNGNNILNGGLYGHDILKGLGGDDTYYNASQVIEAIGGGFDTVYGNTATPGSEIELLIGSGNILGNEFAQTIQGSAGSDTIHGGGGADIMQGLGGSDTYYLDTVGEQVIEAASDAGLDTIYASFSYALAAGNAVEILQADGAGAINLTGNEFAQTISGNDSANILDGKGGADTMQGFGGNDFYYVDNALDKVIEAAGGGTADRVLTSVSYTLATGVDVELLTTTLTAGTGAIDLTGNEFGQTIGGNNGDNIIDGKAGADIMQGFGGGDTYYVDNMDDKVIEAVGGGHDQVLAIHSFVLTAGSEVESLAAYFQSSTDAITLTGNEFSQVVAAAAGNDILDGKGGADTLYGFGGADTFAFSTALGATNIDTIADFSVADDTIQLDHAIFTGLGSNHMLDASAFVIGTAATNTDQHIIYDSATGNLYFDDDGNGADAAQQFVHLAAGLMSMTNADFFVA